MAVRRNPSNELGFFIGGMCEATAGALGALISRTYFVWTSAGRGRRVIWLWVRCRAGMLDTTEDQSTVQVDHPGRPVTPLCGKCRARRSTPHVIFVHVCGKVSSRDARLHRGSINCAGRPSWPTCSPAVREVSSETLEPHVIGHVCRKVSSRDARHHSWGCARQPNGLASLTRRGYPLGSGRTFSTIIVISSDCSYPPTKFCTSFNVPWRIPFAVSS